MITNHQKELVKTKTSAIKVAVQPLPSELNSGLTIATPPAPNRHRTRLLAALAAAELFGLVSMTSALNGWNAAELLRSMKKSKISAAGRGGCFIPITHPYGMIEIHDKYANPRDISSRALSIGKFLMLYCTFLLISTPDLRT